MQRALASADVRAPFLFVLAALAYYYPLVFLGRELVDYDAFVYFYPQRAYLGDALREARLPLWNPYLFGGVPFLANPQTAVLYPPSWLFALGPVHAVYAGQLVLHTFLAAYFAYLFARHALHVRPAAAAAAGLGYGFSGFLLGQAGHLNQLSAAPWLPALLLAYDRAVALRSIRWATLGGLALGLQVLAGHPQETLMTAIAVMLFALVRAPWAHPRELPSAALLGLVVGVLGAGISAAQLLPTLELVPLSIRGDGVRWEDAVAGSLPSYLVPRSLLPPFWLDIASTEYLGYVGVSVLVLGFFGLVCARSRMVAFGFGLCLLGIFLAPGENNGWYRFLFDSLPGFGTFRVPARWLFLWTFGCVVLAALGADWLLGKPARLRHPDLWPRLLLAALVLAAGIAWQQTEGEPLPGRRTALAWAGLAAAVVVLGGLARWRATGRLAAPVLLVVVAAELGVVADWSPIRQAPPAGPLDRSVAVVEWLRAAPEGRVLSVAQPYVLPRFETSVRQEMKGASERAVYNVLVAAKWRETLAPNTPLAYRLPSFDGYDGGLLPLGRFLRMSALLMPPDLVRPDGVLQSRLDRAPDPRLLDLLGVRYVLANSDQPGVPGLDSVDLGDLRMDVRAPARRARLVYSAAFRADEEALTLMGGADFDPDSTVVLPPGVPDAGPLSGPPGQGVDLRQVSPEHWTGRVEAREPGYLIQREAWYPGWRARVDEAETPVLRADILFRAISVMPGPHDVELWFDPTSFRVGAMISLGSLIIAAMVLIGSGWRRTIRIIGPVAAEERPRPDSLSSVPRQTMTNVMEWRVEALAADLVAVLFAAAGPVSRPELERVLDCTEAEITATLDHLAARPPAGLTLVRVGQEVHLATAPSSAPAVERFFGAPPPVRLSRAALESLAVVAYRQPVTRGEIDSVRGVNSDSAVNTLLGRGLIAEVGRRETVGRPALLTTTAEFLQYLGIDSLDQLPSLPTPLRQLDPAA